MNMTTLAMEHVTTVSADVNPQPLEAPEISPRAWKVIGIVLVSAVLFLAAVGSYVFWGLYRYQDFLGK